MNYKILGADQKEYGPATLEQLCQWVAEGRANAQTLVQVEGSAEWKPLASFPELMAMTSVPVVPPPTIDRSAQDRPAQDLAAAVKVPAILLMIAGGVGILTHLFGLAQHLLGFALPWTQTPAGMPPEMTRLLNIMQTLGPIINLAGLALTGLVFFGGLSMLRLQRWGLALTACIAAMLCANNPCCCPIGLVGGIWGLIKLCDSDVRSVFR